MRGDNDTNDPEDSTPGSFGSSTEVDGPSAEDDELHLYISRYNCRHRSRDLHEKCHKFVNFGLKLIKFCFLKCIY